MNIFQLSLFGLQISYIEYIYLIHLAKSVRRIRSTKVASLWQGKLIYGKITPVGAKSELAWYRAQGYLGIKKSRDHAIINFFHHYQLRAQYQPSSYVPPSFTYLKEDQLLLS